MTKKLIEAAKKDISDRRNISIKSFICHVAVKSTFLPSPLIGCGKPTTAVSATASWLSWVKNK